MNSINDIFVYNGFKYHFSNINDPRQESKVDYLLIEIIFISALAVICGADDFVAIAKFAEKKEPWLKTFLKLPFGIHFTKNSTAINAG